MSEEKTIYAAQHWPRPEGPAPIKIHSCMKKSAEEVTPDGEIFWAYSVNVDCLGRTFGMSGSVFAKNEAQAERKVLYKIIECVGDAAAEMLKGMERR